MLSDTEVRSSRSYDGIASTTGSNNVSLERRHHDDAVMARPCSRNEAQDERKQISGRSFTLRGVGVGLLVGLIICFSNMYFGLQTGWVSTMTMPSSLLGFGIFRLLSPHLRFPFSPVENVLVQTVAGSMALMPLGCGFVGVLPAMNHLLASSEHGPVTLSTWQLIIWSLGLCYFGVVFAVPLRRQVIIREKLKFPSGFSTAVLIGVLHGQAKNSEGQNADVTSSGDFASLVPDRPTSFPTRSHADAEETVALITERRQHVPEDSPPGTWTGDIKLLLICFGLSGLYTLCTHFLPVLRSIPIFGLPAAKAWLWTLNPSPAYIGQGIIMGPETTMHMLLGAFIGWAILSPLAKYSGWAPGPVADWETGSKGWLVWISLAIMLADAVASLGFLTIQTLRPHFSLGRLASAFWRQVRALWSCMAKRKATNQGYTQVSSDETVGILPRNSSESTASSETPHRGHVCDDNSDIHTDDAPPEQHVSNKTVTIGLGLSIMLCVGCVHAVFGDLVPIYANIIAVLLALLLSIMGVRALGETDLNPVSGISKLAQLFFAVIIPQSHKTSVLINLVAGAVSEAGALQAGELMQDLKTGHLLGAAPKAQFWGQVIGATAGAIVSALIYRLYNAVYTIPGSLFPVPTAYVWIFTARLVTGKGLPPNAREWSIGFGVIFTIFTLLRALTPTGGIGQSPLWRTLSGHRHFIPGGIAVAVGMYNVPSFTLARAVGGLLTWYWRRAGRSSTALIILASGCILGEGVMSIVNLVLQSLGVPQAG